MELLLLFAKTILLRPYVFAFLAAFLFSAIALIGWPRTWRFWLISWMTAFVCEYSSTRNGIPFGWYHYNGSTVGQELYVSNIPFMDSISFSFLLFASYTLALMLLLPMAQDHRGPGLRLPRLSFAPAERTSWPVFILTVLFFAFIDMVIDPVALRGDRWFLGKIYYYPSGGSYFGITLANFLGWFFVCAAILRVFALFDRFLKPSNANGRLAYRFKALAPAGLYFGILGFNLFMTFWIGERQLGVVGSIIILPLIVFLLVKLHREGVVSTV